MAERSVPVPEGLRAFRVTGRGGTIVLLAATVAGLVWANLPFGDSHEAFWETDLAVRLGGRGFSLSLRNWVSDGLRTLFFFTVGLEISRQLRVGRLTGGWSRCRWWPRPAASWCPRCCTRR